MSEAAVVTRLEWQVRDLRRRIADLLAELDPDIPVDDYRPRDRLGRLQPRNPFADPILLLRAFPALASAFRPIPPQYVLEGRVACPCGNTHVIPRGQILSGDCGRTFLRIGSTVRCATPPRRGAEK